MAGNNLGVAQGAIKVDTSGLKNADIALRSAGDSMLNFGMQAVGAFAAIVGEAAKFEKEMDFVQAVTGASSDEMAKLEEKALDLAKNSIYGPIALSQAFVELVKAGATAEQIIAGVGDAAVQLATAADVEIPFAGENLLNILNTFSLGAEDAVRVADLLAGAANASSVELSDIVTTMRYAGPVAAAMGVSIEDVNTALSVLGRVGIKGSTAGTSLRFMMTRLIPDTDKAKDAITGLGLTIGEDGLVKEFSDGEGALLGLADIMQVLQDKTAGMNDQAKIAVINDIFGVRAMPSVLALMEAGTAGFTELNDAINRTTAADVAAKRMDNLDGSIKRLKATLSAMFVDAGGPFQQMLKDWVDGLRDVLLFIDSLPDGFKTAIVAAIGIIGILSVMSGVFLLTIGNIVRMVRVIYEIGTAFRVIAGAMRAAAGANAVLSAGLLLNPWVLLALAIAAIIAVLVILYFKWDAFREFVNNAAAEIVEAWHAVADWFSGPFVDALSGAWDWIKKIYEQFKQDPLGTIKAGWEAFWNTEVGEKILGVLGEVGEFFSNIGGKIADAAGGVGGFFTGIGEAIAGLPGMIADVFGQLKGAVAGAVKAAGKAFLNFLKDLPRQAGYWLGFLIGRWLRFWFYDIPKAVLDAGKKVLEFARKWGSELVAWGIQTGMQLVTNIVSWIMRLPGEFLSMMTQVLVWLKTLGPQIVSEGLNIGMGIFNAIWNFIKRLPGEFLNFLTAAWNVAKGFVSKFFQTGWDIGTNLVKGIVDLITGLPGTVMGIIDKVINAFKDMVQKGYNAAKDFAGGLWDGFKDGLGINSPSLIEQQLFAISDSADITQRNLMRAIRGMNGSVSGLNAMNPAVMGATPPTGGTTNFNNYAPLVGEAHIRDDRDIDMLARQLEDRQHNRLAAAGRRVVR